MGRDTCALRSHTDRGSRPVQHGQHELAIAEADRASHSIPTEPLLPTGHSMAHAESPDDALLTARLRGGRMESENLFQTQYFVAFLTGNE